MTALAELSADPHSAYTRLRAEDPVTWLPETGQWLVTRWHDVLRVLSDPASFAYEHEELHEVFRTAYGPGLTAAEVDTITRPIARKAADDLFALGTADLTAEYFEPVAAVAGATVLGLGLGCADTLLHWGNTLARDPDADAGDDAAVIIDRLRRRPDDSLVARLVHADADPVPLLKNLAVSVLEPGWLAAWTLAALWTEPEQFAAVREHRHLLGAAVYEALRWAGPVGVLTRRTTRTVSLGGKEIPAGGALAVSVASANRDESVFRLPHRFDVHREMRPHLGFGGGPRHCPAYPTVIALARTALDELFDRMPDLRPAPGARPAPEGWRLRLPGPVDAVWFS
ncbi:cytochrome P450 [Actinophytocola sp.]|uniref:cytochrome P450 n=1 Tax=Actinophytocola sp. TaxID=1872138 RepID=UPI002D7284D6|nr:cytochrome P450 [Actinophytocola sp.]HYQ65619.1 cytochrome P450 [Actinophytocola sp.]